MKNYYETLARLFELDERRTQGEWFGSSSYKAHEFDVLSRTDPGITICVDASKPNRNFIAAAPTMMQVIRHQQEVIERLTKQRDMAVEALKSLLDCRIKTETGLHYGWRIATGHNHNPGLTKLAIAAEQTLAAIEAAGKE